METQNTEYKRLWKDEYLHYISGFANAEGGTLYVGIDDNGNIVGIDKAEYFLENLPNKAVQATGIVPEINLLNENGKEYLTIHIKPSEQPVSCNGKYYIRSGSTLQELNGAALTDFLMRKTGKSWDATTQPDATMDDIDETAVAYFVHCAVKENRLDKEALSDITEQILKKLKLIDSNGQLTLAALLLFGKDIEQWCQMPAFRIGRFGASQADLIIQDNIVCPLIRMPETIISTLRTRYLVSPIHYEGLRRVEPLEIPEDALREIICNAIVHRNYTGTFTQMRVWSDSIELWNFGTLPPDFTVETLMQKHESVPRNPLVAKVFYMAGFIETWGRGYEKIYNAFRQEKLTEPVFQQVRGGFLATIRRDKFIAIQNGANGTALSPDDVGSLSVDVGSLSVVQPTERQQKIIDLIKINPQISAQQMSVVLSVVPRTIYRELSYMQKRGFIIHEGNTSAGRWVVLRQG